METRLAAPLNTPRVRARLALLHGTTEFPCRACSRDTVESPGNADVYSSCPDGSRKGNPMSKGMDRKKETKKKPAKTFDEKRAAKREKRQFRGH